jgi:hypothetical protein
LTLLICLQFMFLDVLDILSMNMPTLPKFNGSPSEEVLQSVIQLFQLATRPADDVLGATLIDIFESVFITFFIKTSAFTHFGCSLRSDRHKLYMMSFPPYIKNIEHNVYSIFTIENLKASPPLTHQIIQQLEHKIQYLFTSAQLPHCV